MTATIITNPTIVVDLSQYDPIIQPQEFIDGGVTDVILKMGGGLGEDPMFRVNGGKVAKSGLRLHGYWWDDPIYGSDTQLERMLKIERDSGLPVLSIWADQEQWWNDWTLWMEARSGKIPWKNVPVIGAWVLDSHYHNFANKLSAAWPNSGIYTGRGFITSYAAAMGTWLGTFKIWFAQYGRQPGVATEMSWQTFKKFWMPDYDPDLRGTGIKPSNVMGHQITGDVCKLPGTYDDLGRRIPLDVSIFRSAFMDGMKKPEVATPLPSASPQIGEHDLGGEADQEYIFLGSFLWVKAKPEDNPKLVDSLTHDQRVKVLEVQGKYAKIEKPAGWVELAWLTKV